MYKPISFDELAELEKIAMDTVAFPFWQRLTAFMRYRNWNRQRFNQYTGLDASYFSKLINGRRKKLDMRNYRRNLHGVEAPVTHRGGFASLSRDGFFEQL